MQLNKSVDCLPKGMDTYLPGFPDGTVSKFSCADLRTLCVELCHIYPGVKQCYTLYSTSYIKYACQLPVSATLQIYVKLAHDLTASLVVQYVSTIQIIERAFTSRSLK